MFSVIIVTYNSKWEKLLFTLKTILSQSYKEFEIIISDDGSEDNHKSRILEYMAKEKFDRYLIIENEKNQGTVKNLLGALHKAAGVYVTVFGPGDGFYNKDSLKHIIEYSHEKDCDIFAGLMKSYIVGEDKKIMVKPFTLPYGIHDLKRKNKAVYKNMLFYKDNLSGAALCYKRQIIIDYLEAAKNVITYVEDLTQLDMLADGINIDIYDGCLFWYEGATGISTSPNVGFRKMLYKDETNYFEYLKDKYPDNYWITKRKKNEKIFSIFDMKRRLMILSIFHPYMILLFGKRCWSKWVYHDYGETQIDDTYIPFIYEMLENNI